MSGTRQDSTHSPSTPLSINALTDELDLSIAADGDIVEEFDDQGPSRLTVSEKLIFNQKIQFKDEAVRSLLEGLEPPQIPLPPTGGWLSRMKTRFINGMNTISQSALFITRHPLNALTTGIKKSFTNALALAVSIQPAMNAAMNPSNASPADLSATWWKKMSTGTKIYSLVSGLASLWVNLPFSKQFISEGWQKLKSNTRTMFKSPREFFDNAFSLYFGLMSGLAVSLLTYEALSWIPFVGPIVGVGVGALGFIIASSSRYVSLKRIFHALSMPFRREGKIQHDTIDAFKHLRLDHPLTLQDEEGSDFKLMNKLLHARLARENPDHFNQAREALSGTVHRIGDLLQELMDHKARKLLNKTVLLNQKDIQELEHLKNNLLLRYDLPTAQIKLAERAQDLLKNKQRKLSEEDYQKLLRDLTKNVTLLAHLHPDEQTFFDEKTRFEYVRDYAGQLMSLTFKLCLALPPAMLGGALFVQKGWDALMFLTRDTIGDLIADEVYQVLIGLSSGIATGAFYLYAMMGMPRLVINLCSYLFQHPLQLPAVILDLGANYIASQSLENVALTTLNRDDTVFPEISTANQHLISTIIRVGTGCVNFSAKAKTAYQPTARDPDAPKVQELIHHFKDSTRQPFSAKTVEICAANKNQWRFFKEPQEMAEPTQDERGLLAHYNAI